MQIEHKSNSSYLRRKPSSSINGEKPSAQTTLSQAVLAKDVKVLEFVLGIRDPVIISETVDLIEDQRVIKPLTEIIVSRLENPSLPKLDSLRWLDILIKQKADYFKEHPENLAPLKNQSKAFQVKEEIFGSLLKLKGRLAFVLERNSASTNGERFLSSGFGAKKEEVEENDALDDQDELLALSRQKKRSSKVKAKGNKKTKDPQDDSFDEMFDEDAFEEAALGAEDAHPTDSELDAEDEDEMLYDGQEDFEEENDANNNNKLEIEDSEDDLPFGDIDGEEFEEEEPVMKKNKNLKVKGVKTSNKNQEEFQEFNGNIKKKQRR
jgi:hypothetical protein